MVNDKLIEELQNNPVEARELLRCSLRNYISIFHYYLKKEQFIFKPFHLQLIKKLEQFIFDLENTKHLIINISPRVGKSQLVKYFISWVYAITKNKDFIYSSYSDNLIRQFSSEIRDLINTPLYSKLFNIDLKADTTAKNLWKIKDGGQFLAGSLGGGITGFGSDFTILDDPMNAIDWNSIVEMQNVIDIYNGVLKSRFNDKQKGRFILIMQRLNVNDLTGYLLKNELDNWEVLSFPAINELGLSIFEERLPIKFLENEKKINNFVFQSQYMQEPVILGGNLIKLKDFRRYTTPPVRYKQVYIVCDTAFSIKKTADNSACLLVGINDLNDLYVLDLVYGKWDFIDLKRNLKNFYQKSNEHYGNFNNISSIFIENKGSGQSLIQELRSERLPVMELLPTWYNAEQKKEQVADKLTRFYEIQSDIVNSYVWLPEVASWLIDFESELMSFDGTGDTHDDMVDTLIYALKIRRTRQVINYDELNNIMDNI